MKIRSESEFIREAELTNAPGLGEYKAIYALWRSCTSKPLAISLYESVGERAAVIENHINNFGV